MSSPDPDIEEEKKTPQHHFLTLLTTLSKATP